MKKLHLFLFVAALSCLAIGCRKPVEVSFGVDTLSVAAAGGTYTTELKSNGDWTIGATAEWLTVTPASGNGNTTLTIEVQPNLTEEVRSQEITATTKDNTASLTISQEAGGDPAPGPYITLMPNGMLGDWEGGSFEVVVHANVAWTVTESPDWVTCSVMEGQGDDTLWMTMNPFLEPGGREGYVVFAGGDVTAQFHVRQSGTSEVQHFLNVIPSEFQIPYIGDARQLAVTCDEEWRVVSEVDWAVLDKMEGEGNDILLLTVAENPLYVARQAVFKFISDSHVVVEVGIIQDGAPDPHFLEVTPTTLNFGHEGGSQNVSIGCDVEWTVLIDDEWLSVSTTEGTGNGSLTVTAANNVFDEVRNGAVTIVSGALSRRIIVTQEPGEVVLWANVSPDTLSVAQVGGVKMFEITSNTDWILSAPSWITMLTVSGTGDATIEMMVGVNNSYSSRIGYITVMRNGRELARVVVAQEGIPAILTADVEEIVFTPEGGSQYFNLTSNMSWEIQNSAEWLVVDPLHGSGNGEILVKAFPLSGEPSREEVLVIRGSLGSIIYVVVRQTN